MAGVTGRPLGSRYLVGDQIGRGATGTVYRGVVRETGEPVAVKVLREDLTTEPDVVARFIQERSLLLRLRHPNLVRVRDLVTEGDSVALVMDLVEGTDLRQHLRAQGTLPPSEAAALLAEVAEALEVAHAAGVVHRDLKPDNVLLERGRDGILRVQLTDFGVARMLDGTGVTTVSVIVGTPNYLAPELVDGGSPTPAADVYALGVVLYELVVGRQPYAGGPPVTILRRHLEARPRRRDGIPDALWDLLESFIDKDPRRRPHAAEAADSLRAVARQIIGTPALEPLPKDAGPLATHVMVAGGRAAEFGLPEGPEAADPSEEPSFPPVPRLSTEPAVPGPARPGDIGPAPVPDGAPPWRPTRPSTQAPAQPSIQPSAQPAGQPPTLPPALPRPAASIPLPALTVSVPKGRLRGLAASRPTSAGLPVRQPPARRSPAAPAHRGGAAPAEATRGGPLPAAPGSFSAPAGSPSSEEEPPPGPPVLPPPAPTVLPHPTAGRSSSGRGRRRRRPSRRRRVFVGAGLVGLVVLLLLIPMLAGWGPFSEATKTREDLAGGPKNASRVTPPPAVATARPDVTSPAAGETPPPAPHPASRSGRDPQVSRTDPAGDPGAGWRCAAGYATGGAGVGVRACYAVRGATVDVEGLVVGPPGRSVDVVVALVDADSGFAAGSFRCRSVPLAGPSSPRTCGAFATAPARGQRYVTVVNWRAAAESGSGRGPVFGW